MTPVGQNANQVSGRVLLSGVWSRSSGSRPKSPAWRWYATLLPTPDGTKPRVSSFRVKALSDLDDDAAGFEVFELHHLVRELGGQIEMAYEEHRIRRRRRDEIGDVGHRLWLSRLPEIEQRLDILRAEHLRIKRSGELADSSANYTIGEVSTLCQLPQYKIRGLEQHGLISPARSEGGQRRYTAGDVSKIKDLVKALDSGKSYGELSRDAALSRASDVDAAMSVSGSMSGPRQTGRWGLSALQIQDWTMRTVAELYLDACEKFPRRDQSVIEYIRSRMPWLTTNYVITLIRRARREGIELPIYRRGRLPKGSLTLEHEESTEE